ncbi:MAG: 5-amino-6-(5-phosphoribosylamino)uracil reductase [Parcubacteria group bacterium GW2011_GWA2_51_10]|nr:MAG: 5-amino-6-(5-phosphoribosylamino)uracil reductase [Parcubacteria group bacterium GW2011_GWA2_51_10]
MNDETYMKEALRLAQKGAGWTNPNPMVGAIIVRRGRIIARGYHRAAGKPHAEIDALRGARGGAKGATMYVNLEPCAHFGRTPPCADAIIKAGIRRVVIATRDQNAIARGGLQKLRSAGVDISVGTLGEEARELNEQFFTFHEKSRPFIALKFAASLDGKLATRTGDSKWITNKEARAYARHLRGLHQAVVIGIETILADDPHLGARAQELPDPLRIILDSRLRIPLKARVLRDSHVIIATTKSAPMKKKNALERRGIHVFTFAGSRISPPRLLSTLRRMNIVSVLVEGGGEVLGSFVDAGLADKVYAFFAPILIGGRSAASVAGRGAANIADALRLKKVSTHHFGDNVLIAGSPSALKKVSTSSREEK